jgi:hypothetical protein
MNYRIVSEGNVQYLVRGGGGGSSSVGGGGGGGFSSGSIYSGPSSYSSGSSSLDGNWWIPLLVFVIILVVFWVVLKSARVRGLSGGVVAVPDGYIDPEKTQDATEQEKKLVADAKETFLGFQQAWSDFDLKKMKTLVSDEYFKKMTLELNVLKNYERQNLMENVLITGAYIFRAEDYNSGFSIFFTASANDKLMDLRENRLIYIDTSSFSEIWHFVKRGNKFVLSGIDQTTADASKFDQAIASFASENNFYYDPDFGWLMMPSRGAIFGPAGFGSADINNHVIGYYRDKIVEFYTYEPQAGTGMQPITVAQAILPKRYDDILVTEKSWYNFKPKQKGLEKIETESNEFNKKFSVWAAQPDQATSFELLATNFMERIYALDFEINIEVVDNVLYLYSPGTNIDYKAMLEVLSWAFDEMKM